jgi:hypothetical protein
MNSIDELRQLAASMRHSAGTYMVPGYDGNKVANLIESALAYSAPKWQDIATAPKDGTREMFVVKAFNVCNGFTGGKPYTSDPWCVWRESDGSFSRWPHHFPPTHWHPLSAAPEDTK